MKAKRVIKRILIIIGCVLLLLGGGELYIFYEGIKAFEEIGESLTNDFLVCYQSSMVRKFERNEEQYNKIDSVAQEMIRSNPEGVLDGSAKQVLEPLFAELFPLYRDSLDSFIRFYPKFILVSTTELGYQPDSTKTCSWGYVWISAQLGDSEDYQAEFNKVYGDYSAEITIFEWRLSKNRGWHIYAEGCDSRLCSIVAAAAHS